LHKHRLENEKFLDSTFQQFKAELLDRIEHRPNIFMDAKFEVKVLGGRVQLQETTTNEAGRTYTEKTKAM
jgi:hypothetical protein